MKQLLLIYLLIMIVFAGRPKENAKPFSIVFRNMVGQKPLRLIEETYYNEWGEPFTVRQYKYYIHDLSYADDKGTMYRAPESYYLIDQSDSNSCTLYLPSPEGAINSVRFTVGVDSADNVRGAQIGALDPAHGMFWTWNTGYVFSKLEGQSDSSHAPGHTFGYHVGGYRNGQDAGQVAVLCLEGNKSKPSAISIHSDILAWFKSPRSIHIAQTPVCHEPGALALQLSENYISGFHLLVP